MKVPIVLHGDIEIDDGNVASTPAPTPEPYIDRCPPWLEERAYRRALIELAREGKVMRPGRRLLVATADLVAWVARHPVERDKPAAPIAVPDDEPIDIRSFRRRALSSRRGTRARS